MAHYYNCIIDFSPKPLGNDWNGSGCHTNYSTVFTRETHGNESGLSIIYEYINSLRDSHHDMIQHYGEGNELRMTGKHETASYYSFDFSVGGRNTSIRIGNDVYQNKKGYFEDRRPSSNCDPYLVCSLIFDNTCLKQD